jgi:tetratricopeptide (TPR) repeat protein
MADPVPTLQQALAEAARQLQAGNPAGANALYELGARLHQAGRLAEAEQIFRQLLRAAPRHVPAGLMLGAVLVDADRPREAEVPLRQALQDAEPAADPRLKAALHANLGMALRRQRKDAEALAEYDKAEARDPATPGIGQHRAEALQNLGRHEEALAILERLLAAAPEDAGLHHGYNDLLYRLGRSDEYLKSYDRAPQSRALMLGKAYFLAQEKRGAEAHAIHAALLARDPADADAAIGAANALAMMQRHGEAGRAFDALLARRGTPRLYGLAAEPAIAGGDPAKAAWLCEQGLKLAPHDGACLAMLSVASRLLEDGRDEKLSGYDTLVRSFELEPPQGFSDMENFNAELDAALDRLHPATREFVNQSLRGGTQTPDQLFTTGNDLVMRLKQRIDEAVARYIAELPEDESHPFLSRRSRDFRHAGSWSSRLRDCGFHTNHIHPMGWISSCYYVAVPGAVQDQKARQGWIKFGEPSFATALADPVRRVLQPAPGRLVLFPSYMWHGTVPFRDTAARTTIAFDIVPG